MARFTGCIWRVLLVALLASCTFEVTDYYGEDSANQSEESDMTFARVNPAGWALYETLTSAQMNALDINVSNALDGAAGGDYSPSSDLKVHGKIIGEDIASRTFLYPLSLGEPFEAAGWEFDGTNCEWASEAAAGSILVFALNRILPNGVTLIGARAWVDPGATQSGNNRMQLYLVSFDNEGADKIDHDISSYNSEANNDPAWMAMINGHHDGGDNQSLMTDSLKSWPVDSLIGRTIYNVTDGSSGLITDNDGTTVTATLAGGTDNDWDDDDLYTIPLAEILDTETRQYFIIVFGTQHASSDSLRSLELTYTEGDYLKSP